MGDYKDLDIFEILLRIVGFGGLKDYPVCMLYEVFKANSSYQNIKLGPKGRVFFFLICVFYVCFAYMFVCIPHVYLVPEKARRGPQIPLNWS